MEPKKILLTSGRSFLTLDVSRKLHSAGHRIYIAETSRYHICRFSRSVEKNLLIPSPRFDTEKCIEELIHIVHSEKIDLFIPIHEEIFYVAKEIDRFPPHCTIFSSSFEVLNTLHNKWEFMELLKKWNLDSIQKKLIFSNEDLENVPFKTSYALKPCYTRGSEHILKVTPPNLPKEIEISSFNPWIAEEWIEGKHYCSYGICREGVLKAHVVYPVDFTVDGHSCINFEAIDHPGIVSWTEVFVQKLNFTGQLAFDFIENQDGLHVIECNPRATSGALLFNSSQWHQALFGSTNAAIFPSQGTKKQITAAMLLYGWRYLPKDKTIVDYLKHLFLEKGVIFQWNDPVPLLFAPFLVINYWIASQRLGIPMPNAFNNNLEWDGEK